MHLDFGQYGEKPNYEYAEPNKENDKLIHIPDRTPQKHTRKHDPIYDPFITEENFHNYENYIHVSISPENQFFIEEVIIEKENFLESIAQAISETPNTAIYVEVSARASHAEMLFIDRSFMDLNYIYKLTYIDE